MRKIIPLIIFLLFANITIAQIIVSGSVTDGSVNEPLPGATIKVVGKPIGTTTDFDGNFSLEVDLPLPFSIEVSSIGFESKKLEVTQNNQNFNVTLNESSTALDEIVVSASRTPERVFESPVTVERFDIKKIQSSSSPTFYDALENLKGVDINTNSLTFKSVNTRGFATFANTRFVQLVDGIDNSSPALNFTLGNLLGMSELDVHTVELLPGASSALYGANAFNGILFMTSKNPFDFQGVSAYAKTGLTSQKAAGTNGFVDAGFRYAHAFNDKFAFKISGSFLSGEEWWATDYRDYNMPGATRQNDPGYDGLNVYGDEVSIFLNFDEIAGTPEGTLGAAQVSRTGYEERDLANYDARSFKADLSLNYRPNGDDLEIVYNGKFGTGNTIYQGANRYFLQDFSMQQHKLEVHNKNFFVRAYLTAEDAGDSYDSRFAGINVNRAWKADQQWFQEYAGAYIQSILGGASREQAHQAARAFAQQGALVPGTAEFNAAFDKIKDDGNLQTGAKFIDKSKIYHSDVNYNFRDIIKFAEFQVGGSFRQYSLNSEGTIFTDYDGAINYNEYGAYAQVQKKFAQEKFKFTGSVRYDKSENFDGNFSPRVSLVYSIGEEKNHNIRGSVQTGFRNPTTQDQYIGLDLGNAILVGSAQDNLDRYTSSPLLVSPQGQQFAGGETVMLKGREAYENAFALSSIAAGAPVKANIGLVKPEQVTAFELGYRGKVKKLIIDISGYYNEYKDFISTETVVVPLYGTVGDNTLSLLALQNGDFKPFQVYTNSSADISSYGATLGLDTRLNGGFEVGINYTFSKLDFDQASDPDFEASFNTPEHKVKATFGNSDVYKGIGFNINYRWNDSYYWESSFADAELRARSTIDAQVSYTLEKWKSVFKIGGANLLNHEYFSAPGAGAVGSQYFVSWTVNP
ncbi:TonB-dependent receptor [Aureivirga sp. CE67]|uniref:TonB-dependent receptor n=1 Tax=Aureivirga sp. CE67 TaxID=1788983 RepID=UPI0018CAD1ED|nr:TonB-dependent receptor [Aureivirga sp. CE67]